MIAGIVIIVIVLFFAGYRLYGNFLTRRLELDDARVTPAVQINDGVDYVPAKPTLLLGQHFSAIAAAGPIVGPILAGIWFGWLPALIWIVIGAIFIGGAHDFSSLVASIRHKASSIGEIIKENISPTSQILFLGFVWLALVYIIIAFTDLTAQTFKAGMEGVPYGPGVAVSSFLYLILGVSMGIALYKFQLNLTIATIIFLPLVLFVIWIGTKLPPSIIALVSQVSVKQWDIIILIYCFIASIVPMWILLQPRGYLGGWLLYLTIIPSLLGATFGGFHIEYPALNVEGFKSLANGKLLIPVIFTTIACGACSGFHGIVSSGTTSKQLAKEKHSRLIGYGAMLLEGLVAVLAIATLMILPKGDSLLSSDPNIIYANGLARYFGLIGLDYHLALAFALLAFSTFIYDTLDVCTRLGRYIMQELLGVKTRLGGVIATLITLLLPVIFLMLTKEKGYLVAWPTFGTSNQLLASLTLLALTIWLKKSGKKALFTFIPMIFMLIMTLWSILLQIIPLVKNLVSGATLAPTVIISGVVGIILFGLSIWLLVEAGKTLKC
jgi:carbon starvation protein